jgi:hypothetical protein
MAIPSAPSGVSASAAREHRRGFIPAARALSGPSRTAAHASGVNLTLDSSVILT